MGILRDYIKTSAAALSVLQQGSCNFNGFNDADTSAACFLGKNTIPGILNHANTSTT